MATSGGLPAICLAGGAETGGEPYPWRSSGAPPCGGPPNTTGGGCDGDGNGRGQDVP